MKRVQRHLSFVIASLLAATAVAAPHELRIPLHDGRLQLSDLSQDVLEQLHLPTTYVMAGSINFRGIGSSLVVHAMNRALGDGCRLTVSDDQLVLHVDDQKLPHDWTQTRKAVRTFTGNAAPAATESQAHQFAYGLLLPKHVDPNKPLVLLVHGLDMDRFGWQPMEKLLQEDGQAVATFNYPDDQPIAEDVALMGQHLRALHEVFPSLKLDVVAFSMGGLVTRGYVEGPDYTGGVDRLILLAPPNHGSTWAPLRFALEVKEHAELWWRDPQWRFTWPVTDGLGEAGDDLTPGSAFLQHLEMLPRRDGVRYTIIEGDEQPARRLVADWLDDARTWIPGRFRLQPIGLSLYAGLTLESMKIRSGIDLSDGPVTTESAFLPGVTDVVRVHADHQMMYQPDGVTPPAAWFAIRARLADATANGGSK